jgi:hypothetical protein
MFDTQRVLCHVYRLMGGRDKLLEAMEANDRLHEIRWGQDTEVIGRILRAHLYVEHYLTENIRAKNPALGSLEDARLTFAQKVALLDIRGPAVASLVPGIRRLNAIRNRISHTLRAEVTSEDADVFLANELFRLLRDKAAEPDTPSTDPVDVLEAFAKLAGLWLDNSPVNVAWAEAFRLGQQDDTPTE